MAEIIDGRIATLTGVLASGHFDRAAADRARAGANDRALFDTLPDSILARKYEAATERSLFRTLRELREVEAEAAAKVEEAVAIDANIASGSVSGELGSIVPAAEAGGREVDPGARPVPVEGDWAGSGRSEGGLRGRKPAG